MLIYYADYFLIGKIIESTNPPDDIKNYKCKERLQLQS